jgi:hypothetical protein
VGYDSDNYNPSTLDNPHVTPQQIFDFYFIGIDSSNHLSHGGPQYNINHPAKTTIKCGPTSSAHLGTTGFTSCLQAAGIKWTKMTSQTMHDWRDTTLDHDETSHNSFEQLQREIITNADIICHRDKITNNHITKIFQLLDCDHNLLQ